MEEIESRLLRAAEHVRALGYHPAYVSLYGSQNYGLSVEREDYRSDYDFKCIVLPSLWELTDEGKYASVSVEFEGGQIDIKDIRLFVKLIENMNPAYLECLLTPHAKVLEGGELVLEMRSLLAALFDQRGARFARVCCRLFAEKEKRLYKVSPAQAASIARYGYDVKQAHHMYRLLVMLRTFVQSGGMQLSVPEEERAFLIDLKLGRIPLADIQKRMNEWRDEMQRLEEKAAQRYGKEQKQAAEKIRQIGRRMVYEHCRREAAKMTDNLRFERADVSDADEVFALYRSLIHMQHSTWSEDYPTREIVQNDLLHNDVRILKDESGQIIAAIVLAEDEEVADIAPWFADVTRWIEFSRLGVAADWQGQGIARRMLLHAMGVSRQKGYEAVRFLVAKSNPIAQRSYAKLNFDVCGEHEMWGVQWLCYQKRL